MAEDCGVGGLRSMLRVDIPKREGSLGRAAAGHPRAVGSSQIWGGLDHQTRAVSSLGFVRGEASSDVDIVELPRRVGGPLGGPLLFLFGFSHYLGPLLPLFGFSHYPCGRRCWLKW